MDQAEDPRKKGMKANRKIDRDAHPGGQIRFPVISPEKEETTHQKNP